MRISDTNEVNLASYRWPGYALIMKACVTEIGLDASIYGTHTMHRSKPSRLYRLTNNLRAVQLFLGKRTVRSLGIEVDDALETAK